MTGTGASDTCAVLPRQIVSGYAAGSLAHPQVWSVEAHLAGCQRCRTVLAECRPADQGRLDRNRAVLLARVGMPAPGPLQRTLRHCGVSGDTVALLTATPSLRRSWLAGIVLVLLAALGAAWLAPVGAAPTPTALGHDLLPWNLVPFLVLAPLLPLAAVAVAFSAVLDPAFQLAMAAPMAKTRLLLVRSVAVVGATLVPTVLLGQALPGPWWLATATLLPALALCSAALAAGTLAGTTRGAITVGVGWLAAVVAAGIVAHSPALIFGPSGQGTALAVLAVAVVVLLARRRHIDPAWMR
jgi:Putative zinc-finger